MLSWCGRFKENDCAANREGKCELGMFNRDWWIASKRIVMNAEACISDLIGVEQGMLEFVAKPETFIDDKDISDSSFVTCVRLPRADYGYIPLRFMGSIIRRNVAFAACVR